MRAREPLITIALSASLFLCFVGILTARSPQPTCFPSSCGLLDIRYPFRLSGDPEPCGMPEYELVCESNVTVLNLLSGKYYVRNISYERNIIHLVDVSLASGGCTLPSQSLLPWSHDTRYNFIDNNWAAFVNCSRTIANPMYKPVACMSTDTVHVHLVHGPSAYELKFLQPSCHALSLVPLADDAEDALSSGRDVAQALQMGFDMLWSQRSGQMGFDMLWRSGQMGFDVLWRSGHSSENHSISDAEIVGFCWSYTFKLFIQHIRQGEIFWSQLALEKNFYECLKSTLFGAFIDPLICLTLLAALHWSIVLLLVGRFVGAPLSIFVFLIRKFQEEHASVDTVEKFLRNRKMLTPARYAYPEILSITNHFEKKLGQGGFGSVFQGKLPGGYLVAVKMLSDSKCNGEDFINEVSTIGRIHHINVMQLIGFCSEGTKRALVYEYMPNGSLDRHIFPSKGANPSLSWEKLLGIALGTARGIEYLHGGCDMCILHFDIKPHNILLDHNFTPKVSDFGLSRVYPKGHSRVSVSAARGTIGYIAPELVSRNFGAISYKSDVYSFGMLLLEMAGARKNMNAPVESSSETYFPAWIYDRLCEERVRERDDVAEMGEVERKLCIVGLWCIQMKPPDRPSMTGVIEMLEGSTCTLKMPPKPFFSSPHSVSVVVSCVDASTDQISVICEV